MTLTTPPRQDPHGEAGVAAIFSQALLEDKQTGIFGDGEQTRNFVYVADVVEANIYAIGSGQKACGNNISRLLKEFTGYSLEPKTAPARTGDVCQIHLDAGKANSELGWTPRVSLEDGLLRTVECFRQARKSKCLPDGVGPLKVRDRFGVSGVVEPTNPFQYS